jgi:hypothetical protein
MRKKMRFQRQPSFGASEEEEETKGRKKTNSPSQKRGLIFFQREKRVRQLVA